MAFAQPVVSEACATALDSAASWPTGALFFMKNSYVATFYNYKVPHLDYDLDAAINRLCKYPLLYLWVALKENFFKLIFHDI